jgi:hypothetical protein
MALCSRKKGLCKSWGGGAAPPLAPRFLRPWIPECTVISFGKRLIARWLIITRASGTSLGFPLFLVFFVEIVTSPPRMLFVSLREKLCQLAIKRRIVCMLRNTRSKLRDRSLIKDQGGLEENQGGCQKVFSA